MYEKTDTLSVFSLIFELIFSSYAIVLSALLRQEINRIYEIFSLFHVTEFLLNKHVCFSFYYD